MYINLRHVAHVRAGDKGNTSNIAVIAYHPQLFPILQAQLTAQALQAHYQGMIEGEVYRYEVTGISALNFVAHKALGGGVSRSMRLDPYGKSLSAALLSFVLEIPSELGRLLVGIESAGTPTSLPRSELMIPSNALTISMKGSS